MLTMTETTGPRKPDRSGTYVRQPAGYRAFVPKPLPPSPPVSVDDEMMTLLSDADRALGRLDGSTENLPNPDFFVSMYVRKEAVLSSQIEGTQASLIDVLEFEARAKTPRPARVEDVTDVVNYVEAMKHGLKRLKTLPVSLRLIREIHRVLLTGVRGGEKNPGEFRDRQNWIGPSDSHSTIETAKFVPPPVHEMKTALGELETFVHDLLPLPALIKVGLVHSQFETIHPFLDGNGRVGRLLITFLLCERKALTHPLLYLSYYFKKNRTEYYDRLQAVRDRGEWEEWLKFFLRGVAEVSREAADTARRIVNLREQHRKLLTREMGRGAATALGLLEKLYWKPIVSVQTVSDLTGLAFSNANKLVEQLETHGLLRELTEKRRNRLFSYKAYLALFKDSETPVLDVE